MESEGRILARSGAAPGRSGMSQAWRNCADRHEAALNTRAESARILLAARAQARAIIAAAHATGQQAAEAERQQGWDRGYQDGLAEAQSQLQPMLQRLAALISGAAALHEATIRNTEEEALQLVVALAHAVVRREVQLAPDTILAVLRSTLHEASLQSTVAIRVNPNDEALVRAHVVDLPIPATATVTVLGDAAVESGGCLIESGAGRVDATIATQLEQAYQLLREHLDAV